MSVNKNMVFVIEDARGKNLLPAMEHGELRVILSGKEEPWQAMEKLREGLSRMTSDDSLLLIGNPLHIAIASHVAFTRLGGKVRFLTWDRNRYAYNITEVSYDHE